MTKLFGTDGIRGKANFHPMTVEVALSLGKALGLLIARSSNSQQRNNVFIAKDTRLSGYCFEQALAAGLCATGANAFFMGPAPTPAVAYITKSLGGAFGIMISASHNPYEDNGIKLFGPDGFKLCDETEAELERLIFSGEANAFTVCGTRVGKAFRPLDLIEHYIKHIRSLLNFSLPRNFKLVLDCSHGALYKIAPQLFREIGIEVISLACEPNGININEKVGSLHPDNLKQAVIYHQADLGIAFDGDADRVLFVDETGNVIHPDAVIATFAEDLAVRNALKKNIAVSTVMSNLALDTYLLEKHIDVVRTRVGDRYVVQYLRQHDLSFGGEDSGHLIFLEHATTGDGLLAAALMLKHFAEKPGLASRINELFTPHPRIVLNEPVSKKTDFNEIDGLTELMLEIQKQLNDKGRLLVRYSGTENKVRIMVESVDQVEAHKHAHTIRSKFIEHGVVKTQNQSALA